MDDKMTLFFICAILATGLCVADWISNKFWYKRKDIERRLAELEDEVFF